MRSATLGEPGAWTSMRTTESVHASIYGLAFSCSRYFRLRPSSEVNSYRQACLAQPEIDTSFRTWTHPG